MKSQDIVILLKLVSLQEQEKLGQFDGPEWLPSREDPYSVRGLEASLATSHQEALQHRGCKGSWNTPYHPARFYWKNKF